MRLADIITRSGRNLRSAKVRTILTALAIGVGGFTLTLTLAAGNGLRAYTDRLVSSNFDPSELIVGRDAEISNTGAPNTAPKEYDESVSTLDFGSGSGGTLQVKRVTQSDIEEIEKRSYIESVRPVYTVNFKYVTREGQKRYTGSGEAYNPGQKPELAAGELPAKNDIAVGEVLLPEGYIGPLGFSSAEDAIGKTIQMVVEKRFSLTDAQNLFEQYQAGQLSNLLEAQSAVQASEQKTVTLKVAAITKRPATSIAVGQLPILLSAQDAHELYEFTAKGTADYQKYIFVYARVKDGGSEAKIQEAKRDLESKGYYVQTSKDIQKAITQIVTILQTMVGVFGLITLIASVFGIINTQYISVLERTREIGLMKALGMSGRDVRRLFMLEATWIGFLGGLIGSIAGILAGLALKPVINDKLDLGEGNSIIDFQAGQIIVLILALMLVATIAGWLPARKAARMDPINALRSE